MTQANFSVDSISEFLTIADTDYRIFDLGRLVREIPREQFAAIEQGQQPYPTPLQQHAWLAIVFWQRHNSQPFIWFTKFPIDERGLLQHAARQHFLQIVVEALGRDLTAAATPEQEALLKQNPYLFTPSDAKRAAFHAQVSVLLEHPPSVYFDDVESFLTGNRQPNDWQQLGVQGLHDVAARLSSLPRVSTAISTQFIHWPLEFQRQLASALEHQVLPGHFVQNIIARVHSIAANQANISAQAEPLNCLIRSLGATLYATQQHQLKPILSLNRTLEQLLASEQLTLQQHADLLVIIAARCWPLLSDKSFRHCYMECLSHQDSLFQHVFADLVALPELRIELLMMLRDQAQHSPSLSAAFARLQQQMQATTK